MKNTFMLFILFIIFNLKLSAQTLVFQNKFNSQFEMVYPNSRISVQTFDDPEAYKTPVTYHSFDGTQLTLSSGLGKRRKIIQVPLSHISCIYVNENMGATLLRVVSLGGATAVFFLGGALAFVYPGFGGMVMLGSLPLIKRGFAVPAVNRLYLPDYDLITNNN